MDQQTFLQLAADELVDRSLAYRDIDVLEYVPTRSDAVPLCPVGCVRVFVAAHGDPLLDRVRDAASADAYADVDVVENELRPRLEGRERVPAYQVWRQLKQSAVFASVRYGGRTLATNVFLPEGLGFVVLDNPYNGGELYPEHLTLVEHRRDDADLRLDAVALRHSPPLTAAERAAVDLVPADQLEANVTLNASCCDNWTFAVWAIGAATFAINCGIALDVAKEQARHLSEEQISRLGPAASARALLDFRREALGHQH